MKLKEKIETILKEHEAARECDNWLTTKVWKDYYSNNIIALKNEMNKAQDLSDQAMALYNFIKATPSQDDIQRWRQKFNQEKKYITENQEVLMKRKQHEMTKREELGYNPEMVTGDRWPSEYPTFTPES